MRFNYQLSRISRQLNSSSQLRNHSNLAASVRKPTSSKNDHHKHLSNIRSLKTSDRAINLKAQRDLSLRSFHSSNRLDHGGKGRPEPGTGIKVFFKNHRGELIREVEGNEGDDMVDLSWEWDLEIEAACEKSIACSTCHCIFEKEVYNQLPEPSEDEEDMLDLAFGLTDTSRLGCQVKLTRDMDGTTITLPSATRNLRVDGSKPSH